MPETDTSPQRVRLDPTISLGALIQIATLFAGFTGWLVLGNATGEQTARDVATLQAAVARQAQDTRTEIRDSLARLEAGLAALQVTVSTLPDLAARLRQLESDARRLEARDAEAAAQFESRRLYVDGRIEELRGAAIQAGATLESLRRASAVNLPGARGLRVQ